MAMIAQSIASSTLGSPDCSQIPTIWFSRTRPSSSVLAALRSRNSWSSFAARAESSSVVAAKSGAVATGAAIARARTARTASFFIETNSSVGWRSSEADVVVPELRHRVLDAVEVRIDLQRAAVGDERLTVLADGMHDRAEAGERAEVARLERQYVLDVGERAAVVAHDEVGVGALV